MISSSEIYLNYFLYFSDNAKYWFFFLKKNYTASLIWGVWQQSVTKNWKQMVVRILTSKMKDIHMVHIDV